MGICRLREERGSLSLAVYPATTHERFRARSLAPGQGGTAYRAVSSRVGPTRIRGVRGRQRASTGCWGAVIHGPCVVPGAGQAPRAAEQRAADPDDGSSSGSAAFLMVGETGFEPATPWSRTCDRFGLRRGRRWQPFATHRRYWGPPRRSRGRLAIGSTQWSGWERVGGASCGGFAADGVPSTRGAPVSRRGREAARCQHGHRSRGDQRGQVAQRPVRVRATRSARGARARPSPPDFVLGHRGAQITGRMANGVDVGPRAPPRARVSRFETSLRRATRLER